MGCPKDVLREIWGAPNPNGAAVPEGVAGDAKENPVLDAAFVSVAFGPKEKAVLGALFVSEAF